jgi:hypothetical protein
MPQTELCSFCYVKRLAMMQTTPYSIYNQFYKTDLEYVYSKCGISGPTNIPPPEINLPILAPSFCVSGKTYTVPASGGSCNDVAAQFSVASAAVFMANSYLQATQIFNCSLIRPGTKLCVPLACEQTYAMTANDTCATIEDGHGLTRGDLTLYNPWIDIECGNLQPAVTLYGNRVCLSPQNGRFNASIPLPGSGGGVIPPPQTGYTDRIVPPPNGTSVAEGTTMNCGRWHETKSGDECATICLGDKIDISLLLTVNPSLGKTAAGCNAALVVGKTYCSGPVWGWDSSD